MRWPELQWPDYVRESCKVRQTERLLLSVCQLEGVDGTARGNVEVLGAKKRRWIFVYIYLASIETFIFTLLFSDMFVR